MRISGIARFCSASWRVSEARQGCRRTIAAGLSACLLVATVPAAARSPFGGVDAKSLGRIGSELLSVSLVARRLAKAVKKVQKSFEEKRRKLPVEKSSGGQPVYRRQEVTELIADTATDLDRAIQKTGEPGLDALRDWARAELELIQVQVREAPMSSLLHGEPYPVARVASLRPFSWRGAEDLRQGTGSASEDKTQGQGTIPPSTAARLLDEAEGVLKRIVGLADKKDLQIEVVVTIVPIRGDLVLFSPSQLGEQNAGERTSGGHTLRLWRGGYLYELRGTPYPSVKCPAAGQQDWRFCYLDLVSAPAGAPILCDLKPQSPAGIGCCGLPKDNCGH